MDMIVTILEAHVNAENWAAFQSDFKERTNQLPLNMLQTFLLQDTTDKSLWRIISVWKSREALDEMRNSGETPAGVVMFRSAGAEPKLSIFKVCVSAP
jgi:quinol monooxygenase YgiN